MNRRNFPNAEEAYAAHLFGEDFFNITFGAAGSNPNYLCCSVSTESTPRQLEIRGNRATLRDNEDLPRRGFKSLYARTFMAGFDGGERPWFGPRRVYGIGQEASIQLGFRIKAEENLRLQLEIAGRDRD